MSSLWIKNGWMLHLMEIKSQSYAPCALQKLPMSCVQICTHILRASILLGHITSLGITMLFFLSPFSVLAKATVLSLPTWQLNLVIHMSRVFPCPGSLLVLEALPVGQTNIFVQYTFFFSGILPTPFTAVLFIQSQDRKRRLTFALFHSTPITPANFKVFTTEGPHQRAVYLINSRTKE